jgi:hypothetical protein
MKNLLKLLSIFFQLSSVYMLFTSENQGQAMFSIVTFFSGIIFLCFSIIKEQNDEISELKSKTVGL